MKDILEIKPGVGINDLKFGKSIQDAVIFFGKPDDIQLLDEIEESKSTVYHYWENGFSLFFDEQKNQLFCCVEIDNKEAYLWGKQIFGLNEKQVLDLFKSKGYTLYESEFHEWGEKRLSFEEINMDFYFEKNKLVSINYGYSIESHLNLIHSN